MFTRKHSWKWTCCILPLNMLTEMVYFWLQHHLSKWHNSIKDFTMNKQWCYGRPTTVNIFLKQEVLPMKTNFRRHFNITTDSYSLTRLSPELWGRYSLFVVSYFTNLLPILSWLNCMDKISGIWSNEEEQYKVCICLSFTIPSCLPAKVNDSFQSTPKML